MVGVAQPRLPVWMFSQGHCATTPSRAHGGEALVEADTQMRSKRSAAGI